MKQLLFICFVFLALAIGRCFAGELPGTSRPQGSGYRIETRQQAITILDDRGALVGRVLPCSGDAVQADDVLEPAGECLMRWKRSFRLKEGQPKQRVRLLMDFESAHACRYAMIPGISWNGNEKDRGNVYHGFTHQGEPWSFAWHRTLIPGATYSEGERHTVGLFADVGDPKVGLACALIPSADTTIHRLIFPEEEMPKRVVIRNGGLNPGRASVLELNPGQVFTATTWLVLHPVEKPRLGYRFLLDAAWKHFYKAPVAQRSKDELYEFSVSYVQALWNDRAKKFGLTMASDGHGHWKPKELFDMGWTCRNGDAANAMLTDYLRTKNKNSLDMGLACLDGWAAQAIGQPTTTTQGPSEVFRGLAHDINNLSEAVDEFFNAHDLAGRCGQPRSRYRELGLAICDEAVANQQPDGRFTGYKADKGAIGANMIPALLRAYDMSQNTRYLQSARSAMEYYMAMFYQDGYLWGASLDTVSIDKETVFPLLAGAVRLYEITKEKSYLTQAEELAWYHSAWQITQSIPNVPGSLMDAIHYETFGATSVATVHMCADSYSLLAVAPLMKLARYTGNDRWRERAVAIWATSTYGISDGTWQMMGQGPRPRGSQDETLNFTDWNYHIGRGLNLDRNNPRGSSSEWLTIWPSAMRLEILSNPELRSLIDTIPVKPLPGPVKQEY